MLEQPTGSRDATSYVGTRILIIGGAGTLLATGLCGATAVTGRFVRHGESLAVFGAGLFILSVLTLVVGVITLIFELIFRR